jgi:putative sugar O-methyltransferase
MSLRSAIEGVVQSSAVRRKWARARGRLRRTANLPVDRTAIDRYRLMQEDNARADDRYRAGAFWKQINSAFSDLIWSGALVNLRNQYLNSRFSAADPASYQIYCHFIWLYYQRVEALDRLGFLKEASEPAAGGTEHQVLIHGRAMSLDFLRSVEEAYAILEAWEISGRSGTPRVFVELGAGYGRLAYVVRKMFKDSTYVILDLPEALLCSASWLERVLPGEVQPYEASRDARHLGRDQLLSKGIWTLGAQKIEAIEDDAADVFVNIFSFAEMPPATIANYFSHVDRLTTGVFYTKQRKLENNVVDRVSVSEATYPIRSHWRECFHRTTSVEPNFFEAAYQTRS